MRRTPSRSLSSPTSTKLALFAALAVISSAACGSSQTPVENADSTPAVKESPSDSTPPETHDPGEPTTSMPMPDGTAKGAKDDTIPDDYSMMEGDCAALGKKFTAVLRAENMAQLSPKLSEAKRTEAEERIEEVATKTGNTWMDGCAKALVGKIVDRKALKCAMDAKTSKEFETCLAPPVEPAKDDPKKKK